MLLALVDPGDEVIVFEPFYENYGPDAILCGAKPVYVPLAPGGSARPRPAGRGLLGADARHHREHPRQPERPRPHPRGAGGDRRAVHPPRGLRGHRRDLRAHPLRRRPRPHRDAARHAGAHRHHLRRLQDLRHHRLADRDDRRARRRSPTPSARSTTSSPWARRRRCRRRSRPGWSGCRAPTTSELAAAYRRRRDCSSSARSARPASAARRRRAPTTCWPTTRPSPTWTTRASPAGWSWSTGWPACPARASTPRPIPAAGVVRFAFCKTEDVLAQAAERLAALRG